MSENSEKRIKSALYTAVLSKLNGELSEVEAKEVLLTNAPAYITSKDHDHADHIEELKNIMLKKVELKEAIKNIRSSYFSEQIAKPNEKKPNS